MPRWNAIPVFLAVASGICATYSHGLRETGDTWTEYSARWGQSLFWNSETSIRLGGWSNRENWSCTPCLNSRFEIPHGTMKLPVGLFFGNYRAFVMKWNWAIECVINEQSLVIFRIWLLSFAKENSPLISRSLDIFLIIFSLDYSSGNSS